MIDHKQGFAADRESQWSWEKPASAGFFSSVEKSIADFVGASLLAKSPSHPTSMLAETPLSRASSLPLGNLATNGQTLTRSRGYVVCLSLIDELILDPSTEAQEVLRITDDRPLARMAADRMSQWS